VHLTVTKLELRLLSASEPLILLLLSSICPYEICSYSFHVTQLLIFEFGVDEFS